MFGLAMLNAPLFSGLDLRLALLLAFALSFSSTVFVVKTLEKKEEMKSLHGRIAIGILIMQDLAAVIFLAASTGKLPTAWALLLLLLIPLRPLLHYILERTGHGELLILYGLVLALGGAELFELGGVKDDLGALIMGVLISTHPKSDEMAKSMLGFKDLFLVGFFLSIGMSGQLSLEAAVIGLLLGAVRVFQVGAVSGFDDRFQTAGAHVPAGDPEPDQLQRIRTDRGGDRRRQRLAGCRMAGGHRHRIIAFFCGCRAVEQH